jgi:hypothetical protein
MTTETPIQTDQATPDAAQLAALEDAAATAPAEPGVGFVGCSRAGRVLRVRMANRNRQHMRVECPNGCGPHETPKAMARPLRPGEAEPELVELAPPAELERDPQDRGAGSRRITDGEIIRAIPTTRTIPAPRVAERLGYDSPASLASRLRRMNSRAEKEGVSAPFIITPGTSRHRPTLVRRAAA